MSAHTPPSSYLKRPLTALLSLSLLLPLSGCFIEETKSDSEARAAEVCEAARQEVSLECVCDPLTALLSCPDGLLNGGSVVSGGVMTAGVESGGVMTAGVESGGVMTAGVMSGGVTAGVESGVEGGTGVLCPPISEGCSCDPLTGEITCEPTGPFSCDHWRDEMFSYPDDGISCRGGVHQVRFDEQQQLWIGISRCGGGANTRLYLSFDGAEYFPAVDTSGQGEDHCELIEPSWAPLSDDQDITSGGCTGCALSGSRDVTGAVFLRARSGEPFAYSPDSTGVVSRLNCGASCL